MKIDLDKSISKQRLVFKENWILKYLTIATAWGIIIILGICGLGFALVISRQLPTWAITVLICCSVMSLFFSLLMAFRLLRWTQLKLLDSVNYDLPSFWNENLMNGNFVLKELSDGLLIAKRPAGWFRWATHIILIKSDDKTFFKVYTEGRYRTPNPLSFWRDKKIEKQIVEKIKTFANKA